MGAKGTSVVILGGARTPMCEYGGSFSRLTANELGGIASKAALERTGVAPSEIDHVVMGNALQTSADAIYGARHVGLRAGIPVEVPALTVNRLCGSGIQSVVTAAQGILLGESRTCLAGGMENMTQAPHVVRGLRAGLRLGDVPLEDSLLSALLDTQCGLMMAQTAEKIAQERLIGRREQDEFALRSHRLGAKAVETGLFRDEIVPVEVKGPKGPVKVSVDEHIKPETTAEALAALKPSFGKDGTVTAGNASGIVDGAAAVVVTAEEEASRRGRKPMGRIVSWAMVGVDPSRMGLGPVGAIRAALEKAGLRIEQVDRCEIIEAFSAQYLAVERDLALDREKVNVNGGAVAIGHPLAATGTRLILTLLFELRRVEGRYGVASACIGGGQGIAMVVESPAWRAG
ncbi:MAG: acetyl-CoA C-acetyltransferase [Planctomycetes bacterium]|nr:acetyl-CoA C-acetyltransferase [Planctomycetota bacterium]